MVGDNFGLLNHDMIVDLEMKLNDFLTARPRRDEMEKDLCSKCKCAAHCMDAKDNTEYCEFFNSINNHSPAPELVELVKEIPSDDAIILASHRWADDNSNSSLSWAFNRGAHYVKQALGGKE